MSVVAGLCSVTLRALPIELVAQLAAECGLEALEWGADVHVPPGDDGAIVRARAACAAYGVRAGSYGSYLLAAGLPAPDEVDAVLDTAVAIGAPNVRVWSPFGATAVAPVARCLDAVATAAAERDLTVGIEFHGGTLTADVAGATALLDAVGAPNLFSYWQPPYWEPARSPESAVDGVSALGPRLSHLHVYEWRSAEDRRPLAGGATRWPSILDRVATLPAPVEPRLALIEFVPGDDPDALRRDAATLRGWLAARVAP